MLSGALLQMYCPDAHACDSETSEALAELGMCDGRKMWGIIGVLTLTSPLLILLTQARHCARHSCDELARACCRPPAEPEARRTRTLSACFSCIDPDALARAHGLSGSWFRQCI